MAISYQSINKENKEGIVLGELLTKKKIIEAINEVK